MLFKRLQEVRKLLGLSQDEMASQLGISYRAYSSYERGDRKIPLEMLKILNLEFNVNLNWFISGTGEMFTQQKQNQLNKDLTDFVENILQKHKLI